MWAQFNKFIARRFKLVQNCLLCQQLSQHLICDCCRSDLPTYQHAQYDFDLLTNIAVNRQLKVKNFDRLRAIASYQWPYNWLISGLKFSGKLSHCNALADLFCQTALPTMPAPQCFIPIPLHQRRFAKRGYNQAACLAKRISSLLNIPVDYDLLVRTKATSAQTDVTGAQRLRNLKNAFTCSQVLPFSHVALIDDVVTTGATVSAATAALKKYNPDLQVEVWSMCVTPESR